MIFWLLAWFVGSCAVTLPLLVALMLTGDYALAYPDVERFQRKRLHFWLWRQHHVMDGLPCTVNWWAHGDMIDVPGGRYCRGCGWRER